MTESARAKWLASGGARKKPQKPQPGVAVGIALHLNRSICDDPVLVETCAAAFLSSAWPKALRYLWTQSSVRAPGQLRVSERGAVLRGLLAHSGVEQVTLATTREPEVGYATLSAETRPRLGYAYTRVYGRQALDLDRAAEGDAWVAAMLEVARALGAQSGVVPVMPDLSASTETSGIMVSLEGVSPQHPDPSQFYRMRKVDRDLGTKYARFPRWGTLYSAAHVEALGGVKRIEQAVRPARVETVGTATYFQLTESVAMATSDEALAKQAAFTKLAVPILPPELPG